MAKVRFAGQTFDTAERIGAMPLMRFAKVAKGGGDSADLEGLAAMYDLLKACIAPADWPRFERAADDSGADGGALMTVVADVVKLLSERPTVRPSVSSDGPPATPQSSEGDSYSRARQELDNRPDRLWLVQQLRSTG